MARLEFDACFPPGTSAIKPKVELGGGATRLWVDAYLAPVDIAKLIAISQSDVAFKLTLVTEGDVEAAGD